MRKKYGWILLIVAFVFLSCSAFLQAEEEIAPEVKAAIEKLKSENPMERSEAAETLGTLRDKASLPALIGALKDTDFRVRLNAADALGNLRDKSATPGLIEALKDENDGVRISVVVARGYIRDK